MLSLFLVMLSCCCYGIAIGLSCTGGSCLSCASCDIASDDFNRSDDTNIDTGSTAGWTESSGSWDITSNKLRCTSAGIAICDTAHPDSHITLSAQVEFSHSTSSSTCDVLVGLAASNNYYYVQYTVAGASGSIDIRRNFFGTHSSIKSRSSVTMSTSTTYTAKVCVAANGTITAYLDGVIMLSAYATSASGTQAGLGASGSGTATFDNWVLKKSYHATTAEDCDLCPYSVDCIYCSDGASMYQVKLVIAGIVANVPNNNNYCPDCADYNGIYFVDANTCTASPCLWSLKVGPFGPCTDLSAPTHAADGFILEFLVTSGLLYSSITKNVYSALNICSPSGSTHAWFSKAVTTPYACTTMSALDIPKAGTPPFWCDFASATLAVTANP